MGENRTSLWLLLSPNTAAGGVRLELTYAIDGIWTVGVRKYGKDGNGHKSAVKSFPDLESALVQAVRWEERPPEYKTDFRVTDGKVVRRDEDGESAVRVEGGHVVWRKRGAAPAD